MTAQSANAFRMSCERILYLAHFVSDEQLCITYQARNDIVLAFSAYIGLNPNILQATS